MTDIDQLLRARARTWIHDHEQTAPDLSTAVRRARRRRLRLRRPNAVLLSAAAVVAVVLAAALALHRPDHRTRPSGPPVTEISGTLQHAGGPPPAVDSDGVQPGIPGTVYLYLSSDLSGAAYRTVPTDATGRFDVRVPRGTFYLAGASPHFGITGAARSTPPCRADAPARTTVDRPVVRNVYCPEK